MKLQIFPDAKIRKEWLRMSCRSEARGCGQGWSVAGADYRWPDGMLEAWKNAARVLF